jgi:hypothetical protein
MRRGPLVVALVLCGAALITFAGLAPAAPRGGIECLAATLDAEPMIFFAVLEGLYRDGVDTEVAKRLASTEPKVQAPRFFIYSCPLCMPAFNAVRLYASRPEFAGDKAGRTTFGAGLPEDVRAAILGDDQVAARGAVEGLIERWVSAHLERMHLPKEERAAWLLRIGEMREKGNAILASYHEQGGPYAEAYRGWKQCPICEGSKKGAM